MRKLVLSLLLAIAPLAGAATMTQSDIDQLVQKLQALHNTQPSLQANFREERHLAMLKDPVVNEGKVWFTLPDKIRREIGGKTPSTTVTDGKKSVDLLSELSAGRSLRSGKAPYHQGYDASADRRTEFS